MTKKKTESMPLIKVIIINGADVMLKIELTHAGLIRIFKDKTLTMMNSKEIL